MHIHDPQCSFLLPQPSAKCTPPGDALEVEGRFVGTKSGSAWAVRAVGEIDVDTVKKLEKTINGMLGAESLSVIVDVEDVSYIDSIGIGVLAKANQRLRAEGKRLCLVSPSAQVRRLVSTAGLDSILCSFDSDAMAVEEVDRAIASNGQQPV